jgi:hypothetical protein
MELLGFSFITAVDLLGAFLLASAVINPKLNSYSNVFKIGLVIAMLGLLGQAFRNYVFISTGISPADTDLPLWAFKDMGISLVAISWALHNRKHK